MQKTYFSQKAELFGIKYRQFIRLLIDRRNLLCQYLRLLKLLGTNESIKFFHS
jgi:hypothetical protein